jgi:Zn-dependent protease
VLFDRHQETPFDLRFRLFGTPVRVHPFFWLIVTFLNFELIRYGLHVLLLWVFCVFVSILLHEMGHIWMGKLFGTRGQVILAGMFGLALGASYGIPERSKRILVYLAGPGIQLLVFAGLLALLNIARPMPQIPAEMRQEWTMTQWFYLLWYIPDDWPELLGLFIHFLLAINWWWPIINLLPIWPLDGGQVSRELFTWQNPEYGVRNSLALSFAAALIVTVNALSAAMQGPTIPYLPSGDRFFILFFAIFTYESFVMLRFENARLQSGWAGGLRYDDERMPWENDPDGWKNG